MKKIPLTRGMVALVDDKDFIRFGQHQWNAFPMNTKNPVSFYAGRSPVYGQKKLLLHREILGVPDGMGVDHRDGNTLDCRRKNLRRATQQQNVWNRGKVNKKTASRFKGVCRDRAHCCKKGVWKAAIGARPEDGGKIPRRHLGYFPTEVAAARAYDAAAKQLFGKFARLNFP